MAGWNITPVATVGQQVPGLGQSFSTLGPPILNCKNQCAFLGSWPGPGPYGALVSGLFRTTASGVSPVVYQQEFLSQFGAEIFLGSTAAFNGKGTIAFYANLASHERTVYLQTRMGPPHLEQTRTSTLHARCISLDHARRRARAGSRGPPTGSDV